jgi:hypothetical protein
VEIMKSGRLPWPIVYTNPPTAVESEREEPGHE